MEVIKQENFKEVINSNCCVVVDVYADWCGPCKMITPVLEQLSTEYDNIKFIKVDADVSGDFLNKFGIMSIPTVMLWKDGTLINNLIGFQSKEKLKQAVNKLV